VQTILRISIVLAILFCFGCATQEERLVRHLVRAAEAEPVAVAVLLPDQVVQATGYDTTVEISLEPKDVPVELGNFEKDLAEELFKALKSRNGPIKLTGFETGASFIEFLGKDPRRDGKPGYKLLPTFVPKPPHKKGQYPTRAEIDRIKSLTIPDDKHPKRYLLAADGPYANGTRRSYLSLDFTALMDSTGAEYLLLFSVDGVQTVKAGKATIVYSSRLVSLSEGVLVFYERGEYQTAVPAESNTTELFDGIIDRWMDQVTGKLGLSGD
jgi:hypothetical protein